jgi:acetyltransferase-like isoleucine patch superfamily enzyme
VITPLKIFRLLNNGVGAVTIGDRTRVGLSNTIIGPVTIGNDIRLAQNITLSGLNQLRRYKSSNSRTRCVHISHRDRR